MHKRCCCSTLTFVLSEPVSHRLLPQQYARPTKRQGQPSTCSMVCTAPGIPGATFMVGFFLIFLLMEGVVSIGVLFRLFYIETDGTGLDGCDFIYQGHLFVQKVTYGCFLLSAVGRDSLVSLLVVLVETYMAIPGLPGGLIIYQGNPSICPKRTPTLARLHSISCAFSFWVSARTSGGDHHLPGLRHTSDGQEERHRAEAAVRGDFRRPKRCAQPMRQGVFLFCFLL